MRADGVTRKTMTPAWLGFAPRQFGLGGLGLGRLLLLWQQRISERVHLRDLEACYLEDAGLSPEARAREVGKPFWRR